LEEQPSSFSRLRGFFYLKKRAKLSQRYVIRVRKIKMIAQDILNEFLQRDEEINAALIVELRGGLIVTRGEKAPLSINRLVYLTKAIEYLTKLKEARGLEDLVRFIVSFERETLIFEMLNSDFALVLLTRPSVNLGILRLRIDERREAIREVLPNIEDYSSIREEIPLELPSASPLERKNLRVSVAQDLYQLAREEEISAVLLLRNDGAILESTEEKQEKLGRDIAYLFASLKEIGKTLDIGSPAQLIAQFTYGLMGMVAMASSPLLLIVFSDNRATLGEVKYVVGVSQDRLPDWISLLELIRIKGVGVKFSHLLREVGIKGIEDLAKSDPEKLYLDMRKLNERERLVKRIPHLKEIRNWVEQAKISHLARTHT